LTIGHSRSLRQPFVGLLAHHLLGVPIWPVGVGFPSPRFMPPVRHHGANHRLARSRTEEYVVSPGTRAGNRFVTSCSDRPTVAVRIFERNKGPVTEMLGVWPADADVDAWKLQRVPVAQCDTSLARVASSPRAGGHPSRGPLKRLNRACPAERTEPILIRVIQQPAVFTWTLCRSSSHLCLLFAAQQRWPRHSVSVVIVRS
jgi:hypothetical protein